MSTHLQVIELRYNVQIECYSIIKTYLIRKHYNRINQYKSIKSHWIYYKNTSNFRIIYYIHFCVNKK